MNKYLSIKTLFLFCFVSGLSQAQTSSNLDIFKTLVDRSVNGIFKHEGNSSKDIFLNLKLGLEYKVFEDQIYKSVQSSNKKAVSVYNPNENLEVSYTLEKAQVKYGEMFRDGFLGEELMPRTLSISGSYRIKINDDLIDNFSYENTDTVRVDEIQNLENSSYPFTKGEIPSEPFLSNLFEPLMAVGTAAVVIVLFFTVRSK